MVRLTQRGLLGAGVGERGEGSKRVCETSSADVQMHALMLSVPWGLGLAHIKLHGLSASHAVREGLCCRRSIGHIANSQELLPAVFPRSLSEVQTARPSRPGSV